MMKTKSKSKTSKTNRKADESPSKPQAKKKGKTAPRKQSAKAKEEPADEAAGPTGTASAESLATAATELRTTVTETPVAAVDGGTGESASAVPPAVAAEGPSTTTTAAALSDSRMPAIGTVLQKRDRQGTLRCECEIVEGGVRYAGTVYRSLSAAAVAAAKDLGLAAKQMNGFTFWGVSKPSRPAVDPLGGLERAWNKYQVRLEAVLERAKAGEHKEPALTTLVRHTRILQNLQEEVA